ncbi:MAG: hypothetical protein ACJ8FY_16680 [Gemmataceae bacterium]
MKSRPPSLSIGDIIEISTNKGFGYAQYTHNNPLMGYLIRVLPGIFEAPIKEFRKIVISKELYHTFVVWPPLEGDKYVRLVGKESIPKRSQTFPQFRAPMRNLRTGEITAWWLWDGKNEWQIPKLLDDQRSLSIRQLWPDVYLSKRVEEGWLPSWEV